MDLTFKVSARIAKPVAEVFEAIANPAELSRYFTTGGAKGRLETGAEANASGSYKTTVTITFEPLDDGQRTLVTISEEGWRETEAGLKSSYGNCQGWMQMLCALKAYKEYGINLREGMFR
jgi:uncharacterized protein YndB with AHSA1/START domain